MAFLERARRWTLGWGAAMLAGSLAFLVAGRLNQPGEGFFGLLLVGALYGLAVLGLIRLFGTRRFGLAVAGILAGPVPLAVLLTAKIGEGERGGLLLMTALLGLAIGLLEWARTAR